MKETSTQPSLPDRIRSWVRTYGGTRPSTSDPNLLPISNPPPPANSTGTGHVADVPSASHSVHQDKSSLSDGPPKTEANNGGGLPTPATPSQAAGPGPVVTGDDDAEAVKKNVAARFWQTFKVILFYSKINLLLVFVPVGIVVGKIPGIPPGVIFAMNAIAIIPLAGLLSFATETVARKLGDSLGALLNVTFGNAVELIIFIALVKNEIRIVQASLLGSILANLLLILGMSFLLGGLRFREQIYNSTVTQMSACLLSLSVISLVLPTAFHASFKDNKKADAESLKISRGTSVILLLVYIIYLLFQLRSHAYMYESTPQHIIDEEATPGPVANWLDSSSSSDDSSSSSSDSSDSERSRETVSKRVKRVMRGNRRRKSSVVSADTSDLPAGPTRTPSFGTDASPGAEEGNAEASSSKPVPAPAGSATGTPEDDAEGTEDEKHRHKKRRHRYSRKHRKHKNKSRHEETHAKTDGQTLEEKAEPETTVVPGEHGEPRRVDFAVSGSLRSGETTVQGSGLPSNPASMFALRSMSLRPVAKSLAPTVFSQSPVLVTPGASPGPVPRVRYGIRRTNSLPDRLNSQYRVSGAMMPSQIRPTLADIATGAIREKADEHPEVMSRTSAVVLLLVSTALVAVCAEFMVDSINGLVETSGVGEIFIGLIVLPIVGNAAEHVTAITVAMKNKMDLAIGVAVGSSIQIALFITPLIVIIGWAMGREMTLYFTLFETVCLFVSAFITNFLILDGRSNYLEGALLVATYVIIGVIAFFYPVPEDASSWGA